MDTQVVVRNPVVFERDGKLWTTSLDVARVFEKEHKHVLEKIEELECSEEFSRSNFRLSEYRSDRGKTYPMIEMTETGFSFIAMGFTGAKAAQSTSSEETLKNPPPLPLWRLLPTGHAILCHDAVACPVGATWKRRLEELPGNSHVRSSPGSRRH